MIGQMNLLIPSGKGIDMEDLSMTDPPQVPDEYPFAILSEDDDKVKGFKKLAKTGIEGPLP